MQETVQYARSSSPRSEAEENHGGEDLALIVRVNLSMRDRILGSVLVLADDSRKVSARSMTCRGKRMARCRVAGLEFGAPGWQIEFDADDKETNARFSCTTANAGTHFI